MITCLQDPQRLTSRDLEQQLSNPRHCLVQVSDGVYWCHNARDPDNRDRGWAYACTTYTTGETTVQWFGRPVRFTLLAGSRLVERLQAAGCSEAKVIPLED